MGIFVWSLPLHSPVCSFDFRSEIRPYSSSSGKMVNLNAPKKILAAFGLGEVCPGYNPKVHGPYDPSVYYGKKDIPLAQVKLGELPGWLARRSKNPIDWSRAVARGWWRWQFNYMQPKRAGFAGVAQFLVAVPVFFYVLNYEKLSHHKTMKYHW